MLYAMRQYAGSWMIKILLMIIVIVFVFWGVGNIRSQREMRVALVNGDPISLIDYNNLMRASSQKAKNNKDMAELSQKVVDQLVDEKLMLQEAHRLNIDVQDEELTDYIKNVRQFQTTGLFSDRQYRYVLSRHGMTPEQFEAMQRKMMIIQKFTSLVTESVKVTEQEVKDWFVWQNTGLDIEYVLFKSDRYKDLNATEEEIKQYFDEHQETYKIAPKIKVRYLKFDPDDYKSKVDIADDMIQEYYNENIKEFEKPKTIQARHILIKVAPDASDSLVEEKRKEALKIYEMAKKGDDFAELAKKYSEGPTKSNGGLLGEFKKEDMVKSFSDKAFSMKAGQISEPVRTPFGWHLIKVEKVNPAKTQTLDEVKAQIKSKLALKEAKTLAYDAAENFYDRFDGDDLSKVKEKDKFQVKTTDYFTLENPDVPILKRAKFAKAAFGLAKMEFSDIMDLGDGYYIFQVIDKVPAKIPELKQVQDKVRMDVIQDKQNEKAKEDAGKMLLTLKTGADINDAVKPYQLEVKSTGIFKRNESIPSIGYEPALVKAAFTLKQKDQVYEEPIQGKDGYYVIALKNIQKPAMSEFEKNKSSLEERLLLQNQYQTLIEYKERLKAKSEIKYEKWFAEKQKTMQNK